MYYYKDSYFGYKYKDDIVWYRNTQTTINHLAISPSGIIVIVTADGYVFVL